MTDKNLDNVEIVRNTYNAIADEFDPILTVENSSKAEMNFVDMFLSMINGKNIADLGCGAGKHGRYCASKGYIVTGFDISEKMIERAISYNKPGEEMSVLLVADMRDLKLEDTIFDGILAMYSLIHLTTEQAYETLINIKKYMANDGIIAITVYYGDRQDLFDEPLKYGYQQFFKDYFPDEITNVLREAGFELLHGPMLWDDEDEITASIKRDDIDFGVIGLIAKKKEQ